MRSATTSPVGRQLYSQYLNLGCGGRFHPGWTNIDFETRDSRVIRHDLRTGVPFPDSLFGMVYSSHCLEHLCHDDGLALLREMLRVMRPGGVIRIVVPDFEKLCRAYLTALENACRGLGTWRDRYKYLVIQMYDQAARDRVGGELLSYLSQPALPDKDFVLQWSGPEARTFIDAARAETARDRSAATRRTTRPIRERVIRWILGSDYEALQVGRFRLSGEVHRTIYDRFSLAQALQSTGFENPEIVGPTQSRIDGWAKFCLDTEPDGTVFKPDSLWVEASKPL